MWADLSSVRHSDGDWGDDWVMLAGSRWNQTGDLNKKKSMGEKIKDRMRLGGERTVLVLGVAAGVSHMAFLLLCNVVQRDINRGFCCYSPWKRGYARRQNNDDKAVQKSKHYSFTVVQRRKNVAEEKGSKRRSQKKAEKLTESFQHLRKTAIISAIHAVTQGQFSVYNITRHHFSK